MTPQYQIQFIADSDEFDNVIRIQLVYFLRLHKYRLPKEITLVLANAQTYISEISYKHFRANYYSRYLCLGGSTYQHLLYTLRTHNSTLSRQAFTGS